MTFTVFFLLGETHTYRKLLGLDPLGLHPEAGTSTEQVYRLVRERKIHLAEAAGSNVAAS